VEAEEVDVEAGEVAEAATIAESRDIFRASAPRLGMGVDARIVEGVTAMSVRIAVGVAGVAPSAIIVEGTATSLESALRGEFVMAVGAEVIVVAMSARIALEVEDGMESATTVDRVATSLVTAQRPEMAEDAAVEAEAIVAAITAKRLATSAVTARKGATAK